MFSYVSSSAVVGERHQTAGLRRLVDQGTSCWRFLVYSYCSIYEPRREISSYLLVVAALTTDLGFLAILLLFCVLNLFVLFDTQSNNVNPSHLQTFVAQGYTEDEVRAALQRQNEGCPNLSLNECQRQVTFVIHMV